MATKVKQSPASRAYTAICESSDLAQYLRDWAVADDAGVRDPEILDAAVAELDELRLRAGAVCDGGDAVVLYLRQLRGGASRLLTAAVRAVGKPRLKREGQRLDALVMKRPWGADPSPPDGSDNRTATDLWVLAAIVGTGGGRAPRALRNAHRLEQELRE